MLCHYLHMHVALDSNFKLVLFKIPTSWTNCYLQLLELTRKWSVCLIHKPTHYPSRLNFNHSHVIASYHIHILYITAKTVTSSGHRLVSSIYLLQCCVQSWVKSIATSHWGWQESPSSKYLWVNWLWLLIHEVYTSGAETATKKWGAEEEYIGTCKARTRFCFG